MVLSLFLPRLLLLPALVGIVGRGDVYDLFYDQRVVLHVVMRLLGVECDLFEDAIEEFGVDFGAEGRLRVPLCEAFLELGTDFLEELGEDVVGRELI